MPEGDTIYRAAVAMHRALAGRVVTRFESVYPAVMRIAVDRPIVGRTIESVSARGKHLLIAFSGDLILRTHMRMSGSWHLYGAGARWQRPARDMRVLVATCEVEAVGFNVPVAELLTARDLSRHAQLSALGPDLLDPAFDAAEAARRIRARGREPVGDVLLNQRVLAGIGNVFKSEILFLGGIEPFTPVAALSDPDIERLVAIAREQLAANVLTRSQSLNPSIGRRTTRSLDPNIKFWVYGRGGERCRRCGSLIEARKSGLDARLTYWCPRCQPARPAAA
ncbi:MAG TPA: DNA-formamidopyrimidine glycosylase family protein [Vicinamibacterales bacterium]|nr:DNA-formamidopyrimidine glycosylase family protein [Vicinamibacterales bacterium]